MMKSREIIITLARETMRVSVAQWSPQIGVESADRCALPSAVGPGSG
jgi:hypothetical protein